MLSTLNLVVEQEIKDSFSIHFLDDKTYTQVKTDRLIYNRIILINFGIGEVSIDENTFKIFSPSLFLIAKGQLIHFKEGTKFTGYELSFGDCFWEKTPASANNCKAVLFNNASANQTIPLLAKDDVELSALFEILTQEFKKETYLNKLDAMAAYLKIIMIKIANVNHSLANGFDSYENQLYGNFLSILSKNYKVSHEVSDYSNLLNISPRKLTDILKRCSNKGAKELINGQLVAEAKRLLQFSSNPIKEIAFELNFINQDQFSHFFKKHVNASPLDYRGQFLNIDF